MKLFRRNEITLNRVHHTVTINEQGERLKLVVNADPMRLVAGLNKAQEKLNALVKQEQPKEEEILDAAHFFATVLFGTEQANKLLDFYAGDAPCVINVCGQVFKDQLAEKISRVQKKMG